MHRPAYPHARKPFISEIDKRTRTLKYNRLLLAVDPFNSSNLHHPATPGTHVLELQLETFALSSGVIGRLLRLTPCALELVLVHEGLLNECHVAAARWLTTGLRTNTIHCRATEGRQRIQTNHRMLSVSQSNSLDTSG